MLIYLQTAAIDVNLLSIAEYRLLIYLDFTT